MYCLNLKFVADFNSLPLPARLSSSTKDPSLRSYRIVSCSTSSSISNPGPSQSSYFSRTETYALLKQQLEVAAKSEDAARYHDELKEIAPHCLLKCTSDTTTLGIRVQVRCVYIEVEDNPQKVFTFKKALDHH